MIAERKWSLIDVIAFFPRIVIPTFLVALTIFFGHAFGGAIYQSYFRLPTSVKVPEVVGKDVQEAQDALKSLGLGLDIEETRYKTTVPKNHIMTQDPPAGRDVRDGRKVAVVVSLGPELVEVPKVVDLGLRDAKITLENAKLNAGKVTRVEKNKGGPEVVLEQNPSPGKMVKKGTKVLLVANIGDQAKVKVPDFGGQPLDKVREAVTFANLHMGTIQWKLDQSHDAGSVMRQDPPANSSAKPGSEVDFLVSAGPDFKDQALRQRDVTIHALDVAGPQEMRVSMTDSTGTFDVYEGVHYAGETVNVLVTAMNGGEYEVYINDKLMQRKKL